jgi:hypothetical protein
MMAANTAALLVSAVCLLSAVRVPACQPTDDAISDAYHRTGMFWTRGSFEGHPIKLLVDTGSAAVTIDDDLVRQAYPNGQLADQHPVAVVQSSKYSQSVSGTANVGLINRTESPLQTLVFDLSGLSQALNIETEGVAGLNLLAASPFQLVGHSGQLKIDEVRPGAKALLVPIRLRESLFSIPGTLPVFGDFDFEVDSGMTECCQLPGTILESAVRSGNAVEIKMNENAMAVNLDGTTSRVRRFHLRWIEVAGIRFWNATAVAGRQKSIGLGLLKHFTLTADLQQEMLWLESNVDARHASFAPSGTGFIIRIDAEHRMWIDSRWFNQHIAGNAGLAIGDEILTIDDRPASKFSYYEARDYFRQAGKQIKLRCRRDGKEFEVQYEMRFPYQYPPQWPPEKEEFDPNAVPSDEN